MALTLDTKRKQRFDFMRCLYDKTEGSEMGLVYVEEIADQIGVPQLDTELIALFLVDEGLIRVRMRNIISITHLGVDEVETALANPDKATTHFPPINAVAGPVVSVLPPPRPHDIADFIREPEKPPLDLPLQPMPLPPREKPGDDLELKSICEAIGLDPRIVTGEATPGPRAPEPEVSDEVHKMLDRARAAAVATPVPVPPAAPSEISNEVHRMLERTPTAAAAPVSLPPPPSASALSPIPISRAATARKPRPQPKSAPTAGEIADLLTSLKLRLLKIRLDPEDMGEAQAEIATAFAQLVSPRPKQPIIAASLASLLSIFEGPRAVPLTNDVKKSLAKIGEFLDQL